jgi:hypothetical protein
MKKVKFIRKSIPVVLILMMPWLACSGFQKVVREVVQPKLFRSFPENDLDVIKQDSPFLKVHMSSGSVYVLHNWAMEAGTHQVNGDGMWFNAQREKKREGHFSVGMDSIALFETNKLETSGAAGLLTVLTAVTGGLAVYCITNPKACFGSCPTFYVPDEDSLRPQAEGFSASIAPSLEATDIDALYRVSPHGREFRIEMRNEALETHVVRSVNLLAVPRINGCRVFADKQGHFWTGTCVIPPTAAIGSEGDCLSLISAVDGEERFSRADSTYLGAKEVIDLTFENIPDDVKCGLVVGCRQTLLSTYLLYQAYAYMGNNVGYWLAQMGRNTFKYGDTSIDRLMGGIEVMIQDSNDQWNKVDQINEFGPLASDVHLLPLNQELPQTAKIQLRMTKGNWRIDYVALALIGESVSPIRLSPVQVLKDGHIDPVACDLLNDAAKVLVTFPGDTYTLKYAFSDTATEYELFLESRGYYLEWIRQEWVEEENMDLLAEMFLNPQTSLKRLAPEFKRVESSMEDCFWSSRYAKP